MDAKNTVAAPKVTVVGVMTKIVLYPIGTVNATGAFEPVTEGEVVTCLPIRNSASKYQEYRIPAALWAKAVLRLDKNGLSFTRVEIAGMGKISDLENERGEKVAFVEVKSLRDATPVNAGVRTATATVGVGGIVLPEF